MQPQPREPQKRLPQSYAKRVETRVPADTYDEWATYLEQHPELTLTQLVLNAVAQYIAQQRDLPNT